MLTMLTALALLPGSPLLPPQTFFVQVAPAPRTADEIARSAGQDRAVVLLHGLWVHPFNQHNVGKAFLHAWQKPGSLMVKRLAQDADVYSFGYAQDVAVEDIAAGPGLDQCVKRLRELGYQSIVLVGHSAGGLIARQYVEDNPDSGVTKVIQLCAPNGGSSWADWHVVMPGQAAFLYSLTKEARQVTLRGRGERVIPRNVQFACVVANGLAVGDGLVLCRCQWTEDLQAQGIPAYSVGTTHWQMPHSKSGVELVAELMREDQPRWNQTTVAEQRRQLLGK